ncbi:MAG: TIGR03915 family putative DNA repair protein, partial [Gemmiger sp.]|nr:TIGR03915 family putative DNA repair protein [Gemmiger sp.]
AQMLGDPDGAAAFALERAVNNEACLMKEFIRFEQRGDTLGAIIHPKHCVLPLLRAHFCNRLPDENFLIYDATHSAALLRRGEQVEYLSMAAYEPTPDAAEQDWQALWKRFFNALTIEERRNEKCQMNHCHKRFWRDMPEMRGF